MVEILFEGFTLLFFKSRHSFKRTNLLYRFYILIINFLTVSFIDGVTFIAFPEDMFRKAAEIIRPAPDLAEEVTN